MCNLVDKINDSEARQILKNWLNIHQASSGETQNDIAKKLFNQNGLPLSHVPLSNWFSDESKHATLMPIHQAKELKEIYPDFPLKNYLRAYFDFYGEHNPSEKSFSGASMFIEAYDDIVGYGCWVQDFKEYLSVFSEVENELSMKLPVTLTDDQKAILRIALGKIMFEEMEYEKAADVNSKISEMLSKITSNNKK